MACSAATTTGMTTNVRADVDRMLSLTVLSRGCRDGWAADPSQPAGSAGEGRHLAGGDQRTAQLDVRQPPLVVVLDGDDADAERAAGVASHGGGAPLLDRLDDRGVAEHTDVRVGDLELVVLQVAVVALGPLLGIEDEADGTDSDELR